jgi:cytochrome b subunit of formate dehydrogenase
MSAYFVRFSRWQRAQHLLVMVLFTVLCVTGLPQKYFESAWAIWLVDLLGGVDRARWVHRATGLAFAAMMVLHFAVEIGALAAGRGSLSLVPHKQDFIDAMTTLRYYLGLTERQARFDRFDYKQKFEYWGMVLGSAVVVVTGLVLLYPVAATQWLPGVVVPVAMMAHSNEGLLAFLTIITWHIFNAHLSPDVFPYDAAIFTGKISEARLRHEHPLEYERLTAPGAKAAPTDVPVVQKSA